VAEKVTFDGNQKLIIINFGETGVDAKSELYSAWKRWVQGEEGVIYLQALRTVGGDPLTGSQTISPYFFLLNGWRIRPYEGDHRLTISGNLFEDGGDNPFVTTIGNYNVLINLVTSPQSITTTIEVSAGGGGLSQEDVENVAQEVWSKIVSSGSPSGSYGELVEEIRNLTGLLPAIV